MPYSLYHDIFFIHARCQLYEMETLFMSLEPIIAGFHYRIKY